MRISPEPKLARTARNSVARDHGHRVVGMHEGTESTLQGYRALCHFEKDMPVLRRGGLVPKRNATNLFSLLRPRLDCASVTQPTTLRYKATRGQPANVIRSDRNATHSAKGLLSYCQSRRNLLSSAACFRPRPRFDSPQKISSLLCAGLTKAGHGARSTSSAIAPSARL